MHEECPVGFEGCLQGRIAPQWDKILFHIGISTFADWLRTQKYFATVVVDAAECEREPLILEHHSRTSPLQWEVEIISQRHAKTVVSFIAELPAGYAEVPSSGSDDARGGRIAKFMIVFASIL
jgi:hypothetical protein